MSLYAVSLQPFIAQLQTFSSVKQWWFADDATGSGTLENVMRSWNELSSSGPTLGYFPNAKKCTRPRPPMPVRICGLGLVNPVNQSRQEYEAFIKATGPLVKQIPKQAVEPPHLTMRMSLAHSDAHVKRKVTVRGATKNTWLTPSL